MTKAPAKKKSTAPAKGAIATLEVEKPPKKATPAKERTSRGKHDPILEWKATRPTEMQADLPTGSFCRIKQSVGKLGAADSFWYCYHAGRYVGVEHKLEAAKARAASGLAKVTADEIDNWLNMHRDEIPPFLLLSEEERREHWRKNPPKVQPAPSVKPGVSRPNEDPATRRLRDSIAADSRKPKASAFSNDASIVIVKNKNPKKEGSDAWGRWALLLAGGHATVGAFLAASGNPTTLKNAVASGHVRVEEKS